MSEEVLHPGEVGGNQGAKFVAFREKEVEGNDFIFDQIVIEEDSLALMGDQRKVRQVLLLDAFTRSLLRDRSKSAGLPAGGGRAKNASRQGRGCREAQELSS